MQLQDRVAVVTGASRGIGRATALALAERGASVILVARTVEPGNRLAGSLAETAAAIEAAGGQALPVACDLNEPARIADLAAAATGWKGRVDVLVNNAAFLGKAAFHSLEQLSAVNWQRQLNVNLTAPLLLAQALAPTLRTAEDGSVIVNITSRAGDLFEGDVPGVPYGVTKAALNRLTLALARDLRPDGITVFALDPGYVRSEIAEQAAEHLGWDIDIDDAHPPEVAARAVADLIERDGAAVSGRIWEAVVSGPPVLRLDGRGPEGRGVEIQEKGTHR